MRVEGVIGVAAPREAVFKRLSDARFFASCVDGVQDLAEIDPSHYSATFTTKIAYLRFTFKVAVAMTKTSPPSEIEATVEGTPLGIVGRLTATARTELVERSGGTDIRYTIDALLAGKLGSMGEPVLRAKAKEMEKQFTERLTAAFAEAAP
ncbi:MAG TPA: SRPBCC domain-containing protein [Pseudolabrys sp.]|nr:SRPBCC domain-containing protein [Pseudolabrys sp.]